MSDTPPDDEVVSGQPQREAEEATAAEDRHDPAARDEELSELADQATEKNEPVHTSDQGGHPAGPGPRSDRDIGGPTDPDDADTDTSGGAPGNPARLGLRLTRVGRHDRSRGVGPPFAPP